MAIPQGPVCEVRLLVVHRYPPRVQKLGTAPRQVEFFGRRGKPVNEDAADACREGIRLCPQAAGHSRLHRLGLLSPSGSGPAAGWWPGFEHWAGNCGFQPIEAMATRTRKTGTGKTNSKPRRRSRGSSTGAPAAPQLPGISAAERRKLAQEEARWRAESDLRTLRQAEEIRRDPGRLKRAATIAAEEMKALQAVRAIKRGR
jgi:hypothetical protein